MVDEIPMDDPCVTEILSDIDKKITERQVTALRTSMRLRKLRTEWDRTVGCLPTIGMSWSVWLGSLNHSLFALRLLADAGVLGTSWFAPARDRVAKINGWK